MSVIDRCGHHVPWTHKWLLRGSMAGSLGGKKVFWAIEPWKTCYQVGMDQYLYRSIFSGMNIHKSQLFWCELHPKTMWTYFRTGREWRPPKSPKIPMHWRTRSWLFRPCMAKYEGHHRFTILIHFNSRYSVSLKNKKLHVLEFFQYHDMTFNDCNKDIYFLFTDVCSISKPCSVCMWHQGATRCFVSPPGSVGSRSSYLRRDLLAISASSEVRGFERNTRYDEIQNLYTKKIKTIESMKILDLVRSKW